MPRRRPPHRHQYTGVEDISPPAKLGGRWVCLECGKTVRVCRRDKRHRCWTCGSISISKTELHVVPKSLA